MKILILLVALIATPNLYAGSEQKNTDIQELLTIMNMDAMVEEMYSQAEIMMQNMAQELGVKPSEQSLFDEYTSKIVMILREDMSWEKMEPSITKIYTENFSEKEIADMLTFYKTDTGKSVLAKLPIVMQQSMTMSQKLASTTLPKIQNINEEFKAELEKHRKKLASEAAKSE